MKGKIVILTLLGTLAAIGLSFWLTRAVKAQSLAPKPFAIRYEEQTFIPSNSITSKQPMRYTTFARRADGTISESRMQIAADGVEYKQTTIRSPTLGKRIVLDGITESKTTYRLSAKEIKSLEFPPKDCSSAGRIFKQGKWDQYDTVGIVADIPGAERRHFETWRAPELGCAVIEQTVVSTILCKRDFTFIGRF
ncbi:MAG: hypothetical protein M3Y72_10725 [Acidobacteriota bacterium]|nr:hypothetical protein [Acidobacteriota bacterium]